MIRSVTVVPSPPLLLSEYAGRDDAGAALRGAAVRLLGRAGADAGGSPGGSLVLVTVTDREPRSTKPALGRRVGQLLLRLAGRVASDVVEVPWDAPLETCRTLGSALAAAPGALDLVVVGDLSARRGEKAPGYLDERAAGFDDAVLSALSTADAEALLAIDVGLAADLLAQGRAALQVAAAAMLGGPRGSALAAYRCVSLEHSDPFGVLYVLARLERLAD